MKKTLLALLAVSAVLLAPSLVHAQGGLEFDPESTTVNNVGGCDAGSSAAGSTLCSDISSTKNPLYGPDGVITKAGTIFSILTGIIATFILILAGLKYINSGGDPSKTASAKNSIIYASVGIVVAVMAQAIVLTVLSKL